MSIEMQPPYSARTTPSLGNMFPLVTLSASSEAFSRRDWTKAVSALGTGHELSICASLSRCVCVSLSMTSRAIAIAKASTANDFSNSALALSTANLYAPTQPGGSLYGLNNSNPFNPLFDQQNLGVGFVPGGIITFGGGVALYEGGQVIGGLGVSGDYSCADHAIAYRMRRNAGLDTVPGGVSDNIIYAPVGTTPTGFEQPHCDPSKDITP